MNTEQCKPTEHHFFNLGSLDMKTYVIACEKCGDIKEFQSAYYPTRLATSKQEVSGPGPTEPVADPSKEELVKLSEEMVS